MSAHADALIRYTTNKTLKAEAVAALFADSGIRRPIDDLPRIDRMLKNANLTIAAWECMRRQARRSTIRAPASRNVAIAFTSLECGEFVRCFLYLDVGAALSVKTGRCLRTARSMNWAGSKPAGKGGRERKGLPRAI
ncbi:MAG: hypothetical protein KGO96_10840 [Elusimicrobia bacterium]|nr:hypothetical protein [Elusimicrobiota bacterium]MDE2426388.1 hypothetical protein [Elusimicrobiota bacterium]